MRFSADPVCVEDITRWRDLYRQEMNCQIVHDSMHARSGWTQPYRLEAENEPAGYGSILIDGPWKGTRTVFEFYLLPKRRALAFHLFETFLAASEATGIKAQSNDALLSVMLHTWGRAIACEKIVFEDQ